MANPEQQGLKLPPSVDRQYATDALMANPEQQGLKLYKSLSWPPVSLRP